MIGRHSRAAVPKQFTPTKVIINRKYKWNFSEAEGTKFWWIGSSDAARNLVRVCNENPAAPMPIVKKAFEDLGGNYSVIIEQKDRIIAAVDRIRSYPLFYYEGKDGFVISNCARDIQTERELRETDSLSILEFRMAGYVTGRETLYKWLYQLQAGEFLIHDNEGVKTERYYLFYSDKVREEKEEHLIAELEEVTNKIFTRVIQEADGAPIWVPLSGGLDSRLVLCKLKQLGCDKLHAFSYGPKGNHDAKWAKEVANRLGVPWIFVPYGVQEIRRFFFSDLRRNYWKFSGEFASLPFMVDEYAIDFMKRNKLINDEAIFINGQSGDFITGGHSQGKHMNLPPEGQDEYGLDEVTRGIIKKHYSLNYSLINKENIERIELKIKRLLKVDIAASLTVQLLVKLYEMWEWQERQSKFVVNGQRSYDFQGHRWFLPLWSDEYLMFWEKIPYSLKYQQLLYKQYLSKMDICGLFRSFKSVVWNWQGASMLAIPVGVLLKYFCSKDSSEKFYHYLSYFGKYQNHYAPFGLKKWISVASKFGSPVALYIETFLAEEGIS